MLTIKYQTAFKKDYKRIKKSGYNLDLLKEVVDTLAEGKQLDKKYKDHGLSGEWKGFRECHITPDWLLIYRIDKDELILFLTRTGSHAEILNM